MLPMQQGQSIERVEVMRALGWFCYEHSRCPRLAKLYRRIERWAERNKVGLWDWYPSPAQHRLLQHLHDTYGRY